jgi:homoserine kinase
VSRLASGDALVGRSLSVDVPATTANLGAGFDALALALDLGAIIRVAAQAPTTGEPAVRVDVVGERRGCHRTQQSLRRGAPRGSRRGGLDGSSIGWRGAHGERHPISRASARQPRRRWPPWWPRTSSSTGAGRAAHPRAGGPARGHADNAAAAILGGVCVVASVDGRPQAVRLEPPAGLLAALYIPDKPLSTAAMRTALPASVPFADAVHNVGAAALTVAALSQGRLDLLAVGTRDRLHEPYRAAAYPGCRSSRPPRRQRDGNLSSGAGSRASPSATMLRNGHHRGGLGNAQAVGLARRAVQPAGRRVAEP